MKEQEFARSICRHLDGGLDDLAPSVLQRLRAAQDAALARAHDHAAMAVADEDVRGTHSRVLYFRVLAPLAVAVLVLVGALLWQQEARQVGSMHADFADVDTEVLTDDLPVVAYLDPGFEIWLYHHSPASAED